MTARRPLFPARFSDALFPVFRRALYGYRRVLDPFAGTGRIHELGPAWETVGVEIEPEWASYHVGTIIGNALSLPFPAAIFDAVCTSCTYGNRMADHHDARDGSVRRSYTHDLRVTTGDRSRRLHRDNSGGLAWGEKYRRLHDRAWAEAIRVLRPGGRFVLNVKDHPRRGRLQSVPDWHRWLLADIYGLTLDWEEEVPCPGMGYGANRAVTPIPEMVYVLTKPGP